MAGAVACGETSCRAKSTYRYAQGDFCEEEETEEDARKERGWVVKQRAVANR